MCLLKMRRRTSPPGEMVSPWGGGMAVGTASSQSCFCFLQCGGAQLAPFLGLTRENRMNPRWRCPLRLGGTANATCFHRRGRAAILAARKTTKRRNLSRRAPGSTDPPGFPDGSIRPRSQAATPTSNRSATPNSSRFRSFASVTSMAVRNRWRMSMPIPTPTVSIPA